MATTQTTDGGKTVPESGYGAPSTRAANLSHVDLLLRAFLFALSLTALVVLATSKQSVLIPVTLQPPSVLAPVAAKFNQSPALIYLLVALCVTVLYSVVTAISSFRSISSAPPTKTLFYLILLDVLMAGIMASAMGSAGAVAYVGLKGNSHTRWTKICNVYGKFCRHIGSSVALSLVASIVLVLLAVMSAYSLHRRSR